MDDAAELERLRAKEAVRLAKNAAYMRRYRARAKSAKAATVNAIGRKVVKLIQERSYMGALEVQIGPVTPPPGSRLKKR